MYERSFRLQIIAPDRVVFDGQATSLSAPGTLGGFQVLYNHAPLLSSLEIGRIKVKDPAGVDSIYAASGGFVEVLRNNVVVLVESAEQDSEIDVARAKAARDRAEKRLQERDTAIDMARARAALLRALNRIDVAGKA